MPLSPQAMRNWKLLTGVSTVACTFHLVFRERYEQLKGRDHVFSGIQRWYNAKVDGMLGVEVPPELTLQSDRLGGNKETEFANRTMNIAAPASGVFKKT